MKYFSKTGQDLFALWQEQCSPDEALDAIEARQREAMEGSFRVVIFTRQQEGIGTLLPHP